MDKLDQINNDVLVVNYKIQKLVRLQSLLIAFTSREPVTFEVGDHKLFITKDNFPDGYDSFIRMFQNYASEVVNELSE